MGSDGSTDGKRGVWLATTACLAIAGIRWAQLLRQVLLRGLPAGSTRPSKIARTCSTRREGPSKRSTQTGRRLPRFSGARLQRDARRLSMKFAKGHGTDSRRVRLNEERTTLRNGRLSAISPERKLSAISSRLSADGRYPALVTARSGDLRRTGFHRRQRRWRSHDDTERLWKG